MNRGFRVVAVSHVGMIRSGNEDAGLASSRVLAVADGMGGHAAGEIASGSVIQSLASQLNEVPTKASDVRKWLQGCANIAHSNVGDLIADNPDRRGMGTTLSAVIACEDRVVIGHVGDSRIYLWRNDSLTQITSDHTYVQLLVQQGQLAPEEAVHHPRRNLLMRAIDGIHEVEMDLSELVVQPGDRFLVCSDGLTGVVGDEHIARILAAPDLTYAASTLLELALAAGAPDNVTILIGHYDEQSVTTAPFLVGAAQAEDLAPRRAHHVRDRRLKWAFGILLVAILASTLSARWLGSQWFVGSTNGHVAIFRGLDREIGPINFAHLYTETKYPVAVLNIVDQQDLLDGIAVGNLVEAEFAIQDLLSRSTICTQSILGCNT